MKDVPKLFQLTKHEFTKAKNVFLSKHLKREKIPITNDNNGKVEYSEREYYEPQDVAEYLFIIDDILNFCLKEKENAVSLLEKTFNDSHATTVYMSNYDCKVFIDKETKQPKFELLNDKDRKRIMKNSNVEYLKSKNQ